jgi:hypothetical protein
VGSYRERLALVLAAIYLVDLNKYYIFWYMTIVIILKYLYLPNSCFEIVDISRISKASIHSVRDGLSLV